MHGCLSLTVVSWFLLQPLASPSAASHTDYDIVIVGAGVAGTVLADLAARELQLKVLLVDHRDYVGAMCAEHITSNGLVYGKYATPFFHSNNPEVVDYWQRHGNLTWVEPRAVSHFRNTLVPFPATIDTVNQLSSSNIRSTAAMSDTLHQSALSDHTKLLQAFVTKRWGVSMNDLEPSIVAPLQARHNWDDRTYPQDKYQAWPEKGYTRWFQAALAHPNIDVRLKTDYFALVDTLPSSVQHVVYTGRIDDYVHKKRNSHRLGYRSVQATVMMNPYTHAVVVQPTTILHFPEPHVGPYTTCVDYSQLSVWPFTPATTINASYPPSVYCYLYTDVSAVGVDEAEVVPTVNNTALAKRYYSLAEAQPSAYKVYFVGHEAKHRPFDVAVSVEEALAVYATLSERRQAAIPASLHAKKLYSAPVQNNDTMTINVIVSVHKEDLAWLKNVSNYLGLLKNTRIRFFIYAKHVQTTSQLVASILQDCPVTYEVNRLPNVGREGHTWLVYMLTREFAFADVNVFLQGGHESQDQMIVRAVYLVQALLFKHGRTTQASNERVRVSDIQSFGPYCPLLGGHQIASGRNLSSSLAFKYNRLHFVSLALQAYGFPFTPNTGYGGHIRAEYCKWVHHGLNNTVSHAECVDSYKSFRGEHIVTDAGLRRALARHRTLLVQVYSSLQGSSVPMAGQTLERLWLTVFKGVVLPAQCDRQDILRVRYV
eukprot:m.39953 g.39953  ORF g.39953 m.39953 type:complete len:710 (-) comp12719_c0_seq1:113-2242(-)